MREALSALFFLKGFQGLYFFFFFGVAPFGSVSFLFLLIAAISHAFQRFAL